MAFSGARHLGFSLHTQVSSPPSVVNLSQSTQDKSLFFTFSSRVVLVKVGVKQSPVRTFKWPGYCPVHITSNTSDTYHGQYALRYVVGRDNSAIKFDRVEIAFILALRHWLNPLTHEGGEETGKPRENLLIMSFRK